MRGHTTQCVKGGGVGNFFDFRKTNKAILFLWLNRVLSNLVPIKFQHFWPKKGHILLIMAIFGHWHLQRLQRGWTFAEQSFWPKMGQNAEI